MLIRVIDIGSNSVKASLYSVEGGEHRLVDKDKLDFALGDSVFSDGNISEVGTDKVAGFISKQPQSHAGQKVHFTFVVATSAVRSAHNRDAFVKRIDQKTGLTVRVLSGAEESFLIHMGIVSRSDVGDHEVIKTIDIGGGSAEFSWSRGKRYLGGHSYELGAIRLTRKFLNGKPFSREVFDKIYEHALVQFRAYAADPSPPANRAIGSSGNVRAIHRMVMALRSLPFAKIMPEITPGSLEDVLESAIGKSPQGLQSLYGINIERARIIMPAAAVLLASLRHFSIRRLEVTEVGLREGVAFFWSLNGHLNLPVEDEESSVENNSKTKRS